MKPNQQDQIASENKSTCVWYKRKKQPILPQNGGQANPIAESGMQSQVDDTVSATEELNVSPVATSAPDPMPTPEQPAQPVQAPQAQPYASAPASYLPEQQETAESVDEDDVDDSHLDQILDDEDTPPSEIEKAIEQMEELEEENPNLEIEHIEPENGQTLAISTKNLNFYYGENQVLHDISLDIPENQVMALIGPSGCGKSTFLRCLNRMNDFVSNTRVSGDVRVGEKNVYDRSIDVTELRQQVGMISQKPNVVPMSIYDNVALGLRLRGVADKSTLDATVFKALEDAGLWEEVKDRLGSPAMALSGGQQQRLCIARAIALNPQILLMDEPCSALDPISTKVVEQLIQNLKRKFTIVIVTHNMQQARRVSDHTAMFYEGRMAEAAPTEQFFGNPQSETAQKYLAGHFS